MEISVIISTYNRRDILIDCLKHLEEQSYPKDQFEVIIADDGSTDGTEAAVKEYAKNSKMKIRYFYQDHIGAGKVRNMGIKKALGEYCFFISDDEYPSKDWMQEHMKTHQENKGIAVVGLIEWYSGIKINDFMQFIAPYGPQFDFRFKDPNNCGYNAFIIGNITLEKKWFDEEMFDETIGSAGVEDTEIGYRLEKKGLRIIFNPKAIVYHNHYQEEPDFIKRMYRIGKFWHKLNALHPKEFKFTYFDLLKLIVSRFYPLLLFNKKLYWKFKCGFFYYLGRFDSYNGNNPFFRIARNAVKFPNVMKTV